MDGRANGVETSQGNAMVLIVGSGRAAEDARGALRALGLAADRIADAGAALDRVTRGGCDLVLVGSGPIRERLRLCAAMRERNPSLPLLLMGAEALEREALGHPRGPDDYVVREFDAEEVATRVRVLLARSRRERDHGVLTERLDCGPLRLESGSRRVWYGNRSATLTATEYQLLHQLARAPERVFTRGELLRSVWGYEHNGYGHTLTTHVNRLRTKLEQSLGAPRVVETVRGLGYRFNDGAAA